MVSVFGLFLLLALIIGKSKIVWTFFFSRFFNFFFASRRLKMLGDIANIVAYESLTNANLLQRIKEKPFFYIFFGYPYNQSNWAQVHCQKFAYQCSKFGCANICRRSCQEICPRTRWSVSNQMLAFSIIWCNEKLIGNENKLN